MADGPKDYRDPKVTTTDRSSSMKWLWYVLGALLLLLLLAWLLGWLGDDETEAVVVEEPAAVEGGTVATEPADGVIVTEPAD